MFYEGRISTVFQIDKDEIKNVLGDSDIDLKHVKRKNGMPQDCGFYGSVLYVFDHNNKKYGFANDASSCNGITELAILDIDKMIQIESLTIGWVDGDKTKAVLECCDDPMTQRDTHIKLDDDFNIISQPESFYTCDCCGAFFKSTHTYQSSFGKDTGYGLCESCEY